LSTDFADLKSMLKNATIIEALKQIEKEDKLLILSETTGISIKRLEEIIEKRKMFKDEAIIISANL
jgi:hypothetical protein